jgi:hypothetical protein
MFYFYTHLNKLNMTKFYTLNPRRKLATYENPDLQKEHISSDNLGKAGIYRRTNLLNDKTYIGSAVNLSKRFSYYYSPWAAGQGAKSARRSQDKNMKTQLKKGKSAIYSSIIMHGRACFACPDVRR